MSIYVYTLVSDGGFAPNPFHGFCTLACCKPKIRQTAKAGDWVIGITPVGAGHRLAYAMHVSDVLTFAEYFRDRRFRKKRPSFALRATRAMRRGDNCYQPLPDGSFHQLRCDHSDEKTQGVDMEHYDRDTGGRHVLVATRFSYFGAGARPVPDRLRFMLPGRYYRRHFSEEQKKQILSFINALPRGIQGPPRDWKDRADRSWKEPLSCG